MQQDGYPMWSWRIKIHNVSSRRSQCHPREQHRVLQAPCSNVCFPSSPSLSIYLHVSNCLSLSLAHSLVLGLVSCHDHKQFVVVAALSIASHLRSRKQPWPSVVDVVRQPRTMCHMYASVAAVRHHPA
ncbi:hypothetical protein CSHISOI_08456 [Colletotrichum shisoi]|uniref:Uncharacterized protein n=1 Tax=Colletotrichum shisoi TaxID=2078593 RepID=A0A5Q4BJ76_9PEZI|nr:hypothetical protein CSHISOI_08456 [Colletotrichum shisoi]